MKVFVAGGTGAVGKRLVPMLLQSGHHVIALTRTLHKANDLKALGADVVVADALDKEALSAAVRQAAPDAIIHQLTSLSGVANFKRFDQDFAVTNRLRTEATDTLLAAAHAVGTQRFIAQSFCGWPFAREGVSIKTEDDPLDPHPPTSFRKTLAAIRYLEDGVCKATGMQAFALRYGFLYGPGTSIAKDGVVVKLVRKRQLPLVGNGGGVWSFTHVEDAAGVALAALSRGTPGIYNVVDDEPAAVSTWLPYMAHVVGAKPPLKIPAWLGRLAIGEGGVEMMTQVRGGSNAKAKRELGWQPTYASWRRGFYEALG